jgi:hypothetical protein
MRRVVLSYTPGCARDDGSHECATRRILAEKLAALQGCRYAGDYDELGAAGAAVYFLPAVTLSLERAQELGIRSESDLFGGVVPYPFVATKTITNGLAHADARAPAGWSRQFSEVVSRAVLPGYTAFSSEDAHRAGAWLLERGAVRVKPARETGGRGQLVAADSAALAVVLDRLDVSDLTQYGVVLEQNLTDVKTFSVGQVRVGELVASYFGTQKLARDHMGQEVYGGSSLTVVRGEFDALLAMDVDEAARLAIKQARAYDAAAEHCFSGFFASRRNYDVVQGRDARGAACSGVLEQSWRIGGASSAEIAALEAFKRDPGLMAVCAECTETYDEHAVLPADAVVYFRGVDPAVGFITKYTTVSRYAHA